MSSLQLVKSAELITTAQSLDVTDCFNDGFKNYLITFNNFNSESSANTLYLRFLDSSNSAITSGSLYNDAALALNAGGVSEQRNAGADRINFGTTNDDTGANLHAKAMVFNPHVSTDYTYVLWQAANRDDLEGRKGIAVLKQTSTLKGIRIGSDNSSRKMEQGIVAIYGIL